MGLQVRDFYCQATETLSYLAWEDQARVGFVVDPSTGVQERLLDEIDRQGLAVPFVLETHLHMDHVSAAPLLRRRYGARVAIGALVRDLADAIGGESAPEAFDDFLEDGERIAVGPLEVTVFYTPGHTAACVSYLVEDALFVGDLLLQPDQGTGRCDFLGGSPDMLFDSVYRVYRDLPDQTRVFMGHDYGTDRGAIQCESSLWDQRATNILLNAFTSRDDFVASRSGKDARLAAPSRLTTAVTANLEGATTASAVGRVSEADLRSSPGGREPDVRWHRRLGS